MPEKPAEVLLYEFWQEQIAAAQAGSPLHGDEFELHDTIYQTITKERGIRISDAVGTFAPTAESDNEYDVSIEMVAFVRVAGSDKTARQPALTQVFLIQREMYRILRENDNLGERVCDSLLLKGARGYDVYEGEPYAVASVPLIINPRGARYERDRDNY